MDKHKLYDPKFGDFRMCKCGHEYHYHFNPGTRKAWGCFFSYNCDCGGFEEDGYCGKKVKIVKK